MANLQNNRKFSRSEKKKLKNTPVHGAADEVGKRIGGLQREVDQHIRNAAGIPGDIDANVRGAVGDIESGVRDTLGDIFGFGKKPAPKAAPASTRGKTAASEARAKALAAQRSDKNKMAAARGTGPAPKPKTKTKKANTKAASKRTAKVGKTQRKIMSRNSGLSASQARSKARQLVKARKK